MGTPGSPVTLPSRLLSAVISSPRPLLSRARHQRADVAANPAARGKRWMVGMESGAPLSVDAWWMMGAVLAASVIVGA